jgi:uncharacterized RDD family membrane protein YckC
MAKQRIRDVKQGKISQNNEEKKPKIAKTPKADNKDIHYAPVGLKIKAFLTDAFMLVMPIMYIVFYFVMGGREAFQSDMLLGWVYILIPLVIVQTLFMAKTGQTPGYRNYRITVVDNHSKETPSFGVVLFRNLSAILSLFTLVGWLLMFFRKDNRNLHDILSATTVILKKP